MRSLFVSPRQRRTHFRAPRATPSSSCKAVASRRGSADCENSQLLRELAASQSEPDSRVEDRSSGDVERAKASHCMAIARLVELDHIHWTLHQQRSARLADRLGRLIQAEHQPIALEQEVRC